MRMDSSPFLNITHVESVSRINQNETRKISEMQNTTECIMSETFLSLTLVLLYSIIFIIGLVGNVIAVYVFWCIHCKKNSIQIYLLNVAIADLLLIFCLPFRIHYHIVQNTWLLGFTFCKILGSIFYMNMYISIVLLGLISLNRYIKINRSRQCRKLLTTKQSIYVCCTLWTVAIVGLIVIVAESTKKEDNSRMCFHYREKQNAKMEAGFNFILVIIFWIVFILLVLSYVKIANNLLKMSKRRTSLPNTVKYIAIARKSFIVLFIFMLCFVPYHIFRFIYIASQLQSTSCYWKQLIHKCNEIMLVLSSFNSCLDPVMYCLMSRSIRKTVFHLICKKRHVDSSMNDSTSEMKQGHSVQDKLVKLHP